MGDPIHDRKTYTIIPTNRLFTTTLMQKHVAHC